MNEYLSKSEISSVDRVGARTNSVSAVAAAQSVTVKPRGTGNGDVRAQAGPTVEGDRTGPDEDIASAAEYARVHAQIADILAHMRADADVSAESAASDIQSMMPVPVIIVPLPPASKEAVESAAHLARKIADQARYAHGAQAAQLRRGTVDQILSMVV